MAKLFSLVVLALAALALAAPTSAKGPDRATITGPGLDKPITFASGGGDPVAGSEFGTVVDLTGFFPAMFGQSPNPMRAKPPTNDLGPKYTVTYRVPGNGEASVVQDLYPYAASGPVTYMTPGQPFFGGDQMTTGGWFQSSPLLKQILVESGLPVERPTASGDGTSAPVLDAWPALAAAALAVAALGGATVLVLRRRARVSPAS